MINLQKQVFLDKESDSWFERNLSYIASYDGKNDPICELIDRYSLKPKKILELGCSSGYRLHYLKNKFPGAQIRGIEPSKRAVQYGRENLGLSADELVQGTADDLQVFQNEKFDLIIAAFFFYVVDRELLMTITCNIDRLLQNNGILMISDFFSVRPTRSAYHHIKDHEMYSYKQQYEEMFTATALYHLIAKDSLHHSGKNYSADDDFYGKYYVAMLHKDINKAYV